MKRALLFAIVVIGCVAVWRLGSRLSTDAVGLAVGVLLGVLASIPASLLILASSRRRDDRADEAPDWEDRRARAAPLYQPPVIVLAGTGAVHQPPQLAAPAPAQAVQGWPPSPAARQFKIVGEEERWLE